MVQVSGSIIANNTAAVNGPDIIQLAPANTITVNFSLIGDLTGTTLLASPTPVAPNFNFIGDSGGAGVIDPQLGPLSQNGGLTQTHALLTGSPAIDSGDPALLPNPDMFDQRGAPFLRVFDGDANLIDRVDMGAYEFQTLAATNFVVSTTLDEFDDDLSEDDVSLREAINAANGNPGLDTITFSPTVFASPQTISLTIGVLEVTEAVNISGLGQELVTVDGGLRFRIIDVLPTVTGNVQLTDITLTRGMASEDMSVTPADFGAGGAVRTMSNGVLMISDVTIRDSMGAGGGGGVASYYGNIAIANSTITGNSTAANGPGGGVLGETVTLVDSTVSQNTSMDVGGGVMTSQNLAMQNSTISGNTAQKGGGIYVYGASVSVSNSTISGNSATGNGANSLGGGIYAFNEVSIAFSTVAANNAQGSGGGLYATVGTVNITNSIVASNTSVTNPDIQPGTGATTINFSLIGDAVGTALIESQTPNSNGSLIGKSNGSGAINAGLGALTSNGGPTQTQALLPGSPAIDAGDPAAVAGTSPTPQFDQRRSPFTRVFNDRLDMGAFELAANTSDFGDAPDTFGTSAASNGASHVAMGPQLGALRDLESDGFPSANADGDDLNDQDDEDGVTTGTLIIGQTDAMVTVNVSGGNALLDAWVDFNRNGMWEASEQIADNVAVVNGDNSLMFDVPAMADEGAAVARFRLSTAGNLESTGPAADGEVEDHVFTLARQFDFGDAPDSFMTTLADDGARHRGTGPLLGTLRDIESNGFPTAAADGDDLDNEADEDGVMLAVLMPGQTDAAFTVNVSNAAAGAMLDAWVDFDNSGTWSAAEQIATNVAVSNGPNIVTFDVPAAAVVGDAVARFRLSTAGGLMTTGLAADGEVEDHLVTISQPLDFGDAPTPFPTTFANDGARHVGSGPVLGALRDLETDGFPTAAADGDDLDNEGDEDGVLLSALNPGQNGATFTVTVAGADTGARLDAWVDFDNSGAWSSSEQIATNLVVSNGENTVTFDVPATAIEDVMVAARFRISTAGGLLPTGMASDGEVEDYLVSIEAVNTSWQNPVEPNDVNNDGAVGPLDALQVINELNERMFSNADSSLNLPVMAPPFLDVNNDGFASPLDAQLVINALPSTSGGGSSAQAASSLAAAFVEPTTADTALYARAPWSDSLVAEEKDEASVHRQQHVIDAVFADLN